MDFDINTPEGMAASGVLDRAVHQPLERRRVGGHPSLRYYCDCLPHREACEHCQHGW
jgi:hypothetical protein